TVSIDVTFVDHPPVSADDGYTASEGSTLTVAAPGVLGNDTDADSDPLTAVLIDGTSHGSLTLNPDGSFAYTPDPLYFGPDSFTYQAFDGTADGSIATVSITVNHVNQAPVAADDAQVVGEGGFPAAAPGVLANDTDPDGDPLTALLVSGPAHGQLT